MVYHETINYGMKSVGNTIEVYDPRGKRLPTTLHNGMAESARSFWFVLERRAHLSELAFDRIFDIAMSDYSRDHQLRRAA